MDDALALFGLLTQPLDGICRDAGLQQLLSLHVLSWLKKDAVIAPFLPKEQEIGVSAK